MLVAVDGSVYIGEWKDGKRYGRGLYENEKGELYVGEIENGERSGKGAFWWSYDKKYMGEFYLGQFHGDGIYIDYITPVKLMGEWIAGEYQIDE